MISVIMTRKFENRADIQTNDWVCIIGSVRRGCRPITK